MGHWLLAYLVLEYVPHAIIIMELVKPVYIIQMVIEIQIINASAKILILIGA
jgi:hypothetical protein